MKLHELKPNVGAKKAKVRRGRGDGSGHGNFCGRGCKGQNARAGGGVRPGFEGGQTPLVRRMPKLKGFKSPNRIEYTPINLDTIELRFEDGEIVSPDTLVEKGVLKTVKNPIKILARGKLTKKVTFEGVRMSAAVEKSSAKKTTKKTEEKGAE